MKKLSILGMAVLMTAGAAAADGAEQAMVGLFTDRCRTVFAPGEEIEVSAVVRADQAENGELQLSLHGPRPDLLLARKPVKLAAGSRATFSWRIRPDITARLRPAGYQFRAKLGELEALPFPVTIADTTKKTHLVIYEANWSGTRDYGKTIDDVPRMIKAQADAFHNFAMDLNNVWGNVYPPLRNPFGLAEADRATVPEEWLADRDFMDLASEELLRNGMGRAVQLHGVWCRTLRLGLEQNMRDYTHTYCTAVQNWKRFPNFLGLSYGDDLNTLGDWESGSPESPQSDALFQDRMAWFIADCAKQHPEFRISRETLLPTNEPVWRAWTDYITGRFTEASADWHTALEQQMANFITTHTDGIPYFQNLACGNYPPRLYRNMTVVQTKTESDSGTSPFQSELCAEYLAAGKRPEQPVWIGSWGRFCEGTTTIVQRAVSLLGRGVDGVGPFSLGDFNMLVRNDGYDANHFTLGRRQRNKLVGELCTRYGDMCLALEPQHDVAVLYSYSQAMFDVNMASWKAVFRTSEFNFNPHTAYLNQAMVANQAFIDIWRAGFSPRIVVEEDVLAGRLASVPALVLVGLTRPLPEPVMAKILAYRQAGGTVLIDAQTTIDVPGAVKLGVRFNQPGYQAWKQMIKSFRAPVPEHLTPHQLVYKYGEPSWPVIRQKLAFIKPFATRDNPRVLVSHSRCGKASYLFVTHDTPPKNWDPDKFWLPNSQWIVPLKAELKLHGGGGAIYDVFSMKQVEPRIDGGSRVLPVDFRTMEGRIFAVLPAAIAKVSLKAPDVVDAGSRMPVEVQVLDAQGKPIDAAIPVEIELIGPSRVIHVFRSTAGDSGCREEFAIGVNDGPGPWTVYVTELLSGITVARNIKLEPATLDAGRNGVFEVPDVAVFNLDAIRRLLAKGSAVNIGLDDGQEDCRGLAETLAESIGKQGVKCSVMKLADALVQHPGDVQYKGRAERFYTSDLPDATCNLILLSGARPSRQLQALHRHGFCSRAITPNYPGTGRAMIDYHWSPFTGGFDAISLAAPDDAGLAKAIEQFEQIAEGNISPELTEMQTLARNLKAARTAVLPPKIAWRPAPPTFGPATDERKLTDDATVAGRPSDHAMARFFGDTVMALAASPNGQFIAAGTNSFFDNVFLLDSDDGTVLWSAKVGPIFIDGIAVADNGTVIAASLADGSVQVFAPDGKPGKRFQVPPAYPNNGGSSRYDPIAFASGNVILNRRDKLEAFKLDGTKAWEYAAPAHAWTLQAPGARAVIAGCWDPPTLVKLDPATGREIARIDGVAADWLSVTPDLAFTTVCGKGKLTVLDAGWKVIHQQDSPQVKAACNGTILVAAAAEGKTGGAAFDTTLRITALASGRTATQELNDMIADVAYSPAGTIVAGSWDGSFQYYAKEPVGDPRIIIEECICRLAVLPDGDVVVGTGAGSLARYPANGLRKWKATLR